MVNLLARDLVTWEISFRVDDQLVQEWEMNLVVRMWWLIPILTILLVLAMIYDYMH